MSNENYRIKRIVSDKYLTIEYLYSCQDKYYELLDDNDQHKNYLKLSYKIFQEDEFNRLAALLDERERDINIIIRKTELLDEFLYANWNNIDNNILINKFSDILFTYNIFKKKWESWNLVPTLYNRENL